jgi:acetone carboxylase, gamma subunit
LTSKVLPQHNIEGAIVNVLITEYLRINLTTEKWECRACSHEIGSARENYKHGLLVHNRDPREVHKPLLDPSKYERTFSPNPDWCRILEFYCPSCGTLVEAEYLPPGHPPTHDIELDIDALKEQWKDREEVKEPPVGAEPVRRVHHHHHDHDHGHPH